MSIVIPVWNAVEVTLQCLAALHPTLQTDDQVIVVDDGSTDQTAGALADRSGWVEAVTHERNLGFAAACNDGAAVARHEIIIFLNNDTVPDGDWITDLLAPFSDDTIAASGPMSNAVSGRQQIVDDHGQPILGVEARTVVARRREHAIAVWTDVSRLVGFCLAVRAEVFHELRGFDLRYGQGGFEDDDLCTRMLLAGWRLVIVSTAYMFHQYHSTFEANGVDWFGIQQRNGDLYRQRLQDACPLSVLLRCGNDPERLRQSLRSVEESMGAHRHELLLLVEDPEPIAELLAGLPTATVVVTTRVDDRGWRRGQHLATGLRRISMRAGDRLTSDDVERLLAAPYGSQSQSVLT